MIVRITIGKRVFDPDLGCNVIAPFVDHETGNTSCVDIGRNRDGTEIVMTRDSSLLIFKSIGFNVTSRKYLPIADVQKNTLRKMNGVQTRPSGAPVQDTGSVIVNDKTHLGRERMRKYFADILYICREGRKRGASHIMITSRSRHYRDKTSGSK